MRGMFHILLVIALLTQAVASAAVDSDGCGGTADSTTMQHGADHHGNTAPSSMPMDCCDDGVNCAVNCDVNVQNAVVMTIALAVAQSTTGPRPYRLVDRVLRPHRAPDLRPPITI